MRLQRLTLSYKIENESTLTPAAVAHAFGAARSFDCMYANGADVDQQPGDGEEAQRPSRMDETR